MTSSDLMKACVIVFVLTSPVKRLSWGCGPMGAEFWAQTQRVDSEWFEINDLV